MSKITRRSYKRKKIVMGLALFGAIGLVSTGFAAWVLSASSSADSGMHMNVGKVDDKSMTVVIDGTYKTSEVNGKNKVSEIGTSASAYDKFSFNPKAEDITGRVRWGSGESGDDEPENMSLTIFGHVDNAQNLAPVANHGLSILLKGEVPSQLQAASSEGKYKIGDVEYDRDAYINLPACFTASQDIDYTLEGDSAVKTAYFRYDVAFTWGAQFGDPASNPSEYYDAEGLSIEMDHVKGVLDDMYTLIKEVTFFEVTVTAIPN